MLTSMLQGTHRCNPQQSSHNLCQSCSADVSLEASYDNTVDSSIDGPAPWDNEEPVAQSQEDNMEAAAAEPLRQAEEAVGMSSPSQTTTEMDEEAGKKGYGKAYAAFGGGREGLEACAASKSSSSCTSHNRLSYGGNSSTGAKELTQSSASQTTQ